MKAIETSYKGYRFRSRLEARWAVFFDALEIKWEYEHEGFELPGNKRYLPDFWLPTFDGGIWVEVKPEGGDLTKPKLFADTYQEAIWFCEGTPQLAIYKIYDARNGETFLDLSGNKVRFDAPGKLSCGMPNWDQAENEDRMFGMPCCFECCKGKDCDCESMVKISQKDYSNSYASYPVNNYIEAINKAKSSRFEFGESG